MILWENAEAQRKTVEKNYEDMSQRLRDADRTMQAMQKEIVKYQVCHHKYISRVSSYRNLVLMYFKFL